ncbi:lipocalin [Sulfitobacter sp. F26204]|uniref:lipocalin n=1 Tax=Sulfitobacter sp. F26204 TaxID=2996014 RepID=UPI00225DEB9B|nr:lipocalin [Sulfitobacter sp. F26204]MCX7560833.1 lipocalin [Sulfitobacter sp. F26204]
MAEPPADVEIGFRNPTAVIAGTSRFDAARFAGEWQTVACLGRCAGSVRYLAATDGVYLRRTAGGDTPYLIAAPGVLRRTGAEETLVVMWVDEGFRTAAIGDADGRWAAVLDRSGKPGADRVKAAMEILDFNGWDVSQLRKIK